MKQTKANCPAGFETLPAHVRRCIINGCRSPEEIDRQTRIALDTIKIKPLSPKEASELVALESINIISTI